MVKLNLVTIRGLLVKNIFGFGKYFYLFLIGVVLITAQLVLANDELFQNNLLKMDVHKTPAGNIKVTLYTKKPYKDSVVVNKKTDNEYVIYLPETASSLTAKPSSNSASDVVRSIEVKTQQYSPQQDQKGYTKIIFSTSEPVEITPQVKTLASGYQLSEKEYKELITTVKKQPQSAKYSPPRPKAEKFQPKTKTAQNNIQKVIPNAIYKVPATKIVQKEIKPEKKLQEAVSRPIVSKQAEIQTEVNPEAVNTAEPKEQIIATEKITESPAETALKPLPAKVEQPKLRKYQKILNWLEYYYYFVLTLILIPLIFLLFLVRGARKTINKIDNQKEIFTSHLDEKPIVPTDFSEKISDDMNWREKFQTYVEETSKPTEEVSQPNFVEDNQDLDNLFGMEVEETQVIQEEAAVESDFADLLNVPADQELGGEKEVSIDEIFGDDSEEADLGVLETYELEEKSEEDEIIQYSYAIDGKRGFHLVEYEGSTSLVGYVDDDIFVLKRFPGIVQSPVQARLNEQKTNSFTYMVKVDGFKSIVEVFKDKMELLIEL